MPSITSIAVAIGLLSGQALALPTFYIKKAGKCAIPDMPFGKHGAPILNTQVAFSLMDTAGAAVSEWKVDTTYTLKIDRGTGPLKFHTYVHTTKGELMNDAAVPGDVSVNGECTDKGWASKNPADSHTLMWKSPSCCTTDETVTVSAATAIGVQAEYNTNMVTLAPAADSCSTTCILKDAVESTKEAAESVADAAESAEGDTPDGTTTIGLSLAVLSVAIIAML